MSNWGYMCGSSSFHPYECSHDKYCEHCTLAKTEWHNPKNCALCDWLPDEHPDKGKLIRMCKEKFAIRIKPYDLTPRKQRIKVTKFISYIKQLENPQKELPF